MPGEWSSTRRMRRTRPLRWSSPVSPPAWATPWL